MKTKTYGAWMLAGAVTLAGASMAERASAQSDPAELALAQQQNCMSCHSVNRQFMGPALHDVADKYATRPDAAKYLARKITEGSTGVWGPVPMPANTQLTPDQAMDLANWILTLK